MVDFKNRNKNRVDIDALVKAAETVGSGTPRDDRFWQPTRGKDGNGYAVIRFLPGREDSGLHWARYWDHQFKGPSGQWYVEKSLTTLGQNDPVSEYNQKMWNAYPEGSNERKAVSARARRLNYVSNILVIQDPANPENDGKVFLYRYGKKIHDKIMECMKPKFADQVRFNPFDENEGADFTLRISSEKVGDRLMPKYEASTFKEPSKLFGGDLKKFEAIWDQQHMLGEWSDPKNFKSYDDLERAFMKVMGERSAGSAGAGNSSKIEMEDAAPAPGFHSAEESMGEEVDETTALFAKLVNS